MSSVRSAGYRRVPSDHFEPQDNVDPVAQRKLRGQLEQIDYTAFASNQAVIGQALTPADASKFQRLGVAAAHARAEWVSSALAMTEATRALSPEQVAKLTQLRTRYEELTEVYEAMRRMVERGYLPYRLSQT
jgi:hypothetical protein